MDPSPASPTVDAQDADPAADGFSALGIEPSLLATLATLGYEEPTPIQREAIPPLLEGRDLLAEAPTGTGKTAAFALPMLQRIELGRTDEGRPAALVLVPTRELAMQVAEALHTYGRGRDVRVIPVYGGQPIGLQLRGLRRGVDVVVATPGRAVDHLKRGSIRLDEVSVVILDEADEMLDMGFAEDLEMILSGTPGTRQTALFSATISSVVARMASRHLRAPVRVTVRAKGSADEGLPRVRQVAYVVRRADKLAALCRLLDLEDPTSVLVFARTRGEVDELAEALSGRGHDAGALHGGLSQEQRDRIMGRFRDGALDVLVATDVAARGLDIEHVSHVVNYDVPAAADQYVHRIGRTGRAGREGVAITLVEPREHRQLRNIEAATRTRLEIAKLPTVADLRERRLERLTATLRETLLADGFDRFRAVVEPLADEFDLVDIALAAVSLADTAGGREDEEVELAAATLPSFAVARPVDARGHPVRAPGPGAPAGPPGARGPAGGPGQAPRRPPPPPEGGWARLIIGGGRNAGLRPGDIVGAITNEARVDASVIGAIQIADGYAVVEVARIAAPDILAALKAATIRGKKLPVRLDDPEPDGRRGAR